MFLNVPFDKTYESLFIALVSSLVAIGRVPRCVLELPELGQGRLARILRLIRSCGVSIHDLSRVGLPVRFNMPFELGIAVALARVQGGHKFIVLEAERHRLVRTLSDVNGIDPGIHGGKSSGVVSCVFSHLGRPHGNPPVEEATSIFRKLQSAVPNLKKTHGRSSIYSRAIFRELFESAIRLATERNLVEG